MSKIRVGVVRGGPSSEYAISLKTGENILRHLDTEKYLPVDILLTKRGEWYAKGLRTDLASIAQHVDVVWNALHGTFGEDGKAQQLFEQFSIPYTGSDVLGSAVGMHKGLAKERFEKAGLLTPRGMVLTPQDPIEDFLVALLREQRLPVIVKPLSGGSSVATKLVRNLSDLRGAIEDAQQYGDVLIEEYIEGREATVCVIDGSGEGEHVVLSPIEIVPPSANPFFDYDSKYSGASQEICPGRFTPEQTEVLRELAEKAHRAIGARHYSRSDFILSPKGVYILEINTLPGLTAESLLPKALRASGAELSEFLDHIIGLTLAE
jgi:D-alanine--D-alanine ligase